MTDPSSVCTPTGTVLGSECRYSGRRRLSGVVLSGRVVPTPNWKGGGVWTSGVVEW